MADASQQSGRHDLPRLPAPALAGVYLLLCLSPLVLAGFAQAAPLDGWEAFGAGLGVSGLAAMVVQLLTSGRFRVVSGKMGIDRIMAFHKIAALAVLVALLLHPLAYVLPTLLDDPARGIERLIAYHLLPAYRSGVVALAALVMLVVLAVLQNRLRYELWRAGHVGLALLAVGGGLHHALTAGRLSAMGPVQMFWWAAAALALAVIAVLYGWRWWRLHGRPWELRRVTRKAARIWELEIAPGQGTAPLAYRAGQFVWMTEGRRRFPLFDHPFSVAGSPARPELRLIVKEAGDFTGGIGKLEPGTAIGIDGPYGTFTLSDHPADAVVLIAGGAGIAPIMGLMRDMVARRDPRPVRLAYAVGHPANFVCLDEIAAARQVLDLQVMLISEQPDAGWSGEVGMLDPTRLAWLLDGLRPEGTVAMICGPGPMVSAVSDGLLGQGMPMDRVVYERFDYSGALGARKDRRESAQAAGLLAALAAMTWLLSRLLP